MNQSSWFKVGTWLGTNCPLWKCHQFSSMHQSQLVIFNERSTTIDKNHTHGYCLFHFPPHSRLRFVWKYSNRFIFNNNNNSVNTICIDVVVECYLLTSSSHATCWRCRRLRFGWRRCCAPLIVIVYSVLSSSLSSSTASVVDIVSPLRHPFIVYSISLALPLFQANR